MWMRTAGLPTFKKLYRIINTDLTPGVYTVEIFNSTQPSSFTPSIHSHPTFFLFTSVLLSILNIFSLHASILSCIVCSFVHLYIIRHALRPAYYINLPSMHRRVRARVCVECV